MYHLQLSNFCGFYMFYKSKSLEASVQAKACADVDEHKIRPLLFYCRSKIGSELIRGERIRFTYVSCGLWFGHPNNHS